MDDRSIHIRDANQSVFVSGSDSIVSLRFGDSGVVLPLQREQFRLPHRFGPGVQGRLPHELDILNPTAGKLPFVGRDDLLGELKAWLNGKHHISVHALTGRAGTGKTRLAVELCAAVDSASDGKGPWLAGFLSPRNLASVVETLATRSFTWERHTLLVLDYAAQCAEPLARWLDRLAYQQLDTKLRILLLEREAPEDFGWWHDLAAPAFHGAQVRLNLFHALRPRPLPDLAALEERRKVMATALQAARALRPGASLTGDVPEPGRDTAFDARLVQPQFGNPLTLVMAGVIALDRGPQGALALRRLDAARHLGRRELHRLMAMAESCGSNPETMRHIVAFNGLAGGLPLHGLRKVIADELAASYRQDNLDALVTLLDQELAPRVDGDERVRVRLATIQPDLIGEGAVIEALSNPPSRNAEAPDIVLRAFVVGQSDAAHALVRLIQDYSYAVDELSSESKLSSTENFVLNLLLSLISKIADIDQLVLIVNVSPRDTVVLRDLASEITQKLAEFFCHSANKSGDPIAVERAMLWSINLATRLSNQGQHESALEAAKTAFYLSTIGSKLHLSAFVPYFSELLQILSITSDNLNQFDTAIHFARRLVGVRRDLCRDQHDLDKEHSTKLALHLAEALNSLAIRFSNVRRYQASLKAATEAFRIICDLGQKHPGEFMANRAGLLMNISNIKSAMISGIPNSPDLGKRKEALAMAEEAVQLYSVLTQEKPDTFTPYLASICSTPLV